MTLQAVKERLSQLGYVAQSSEDTALQFLMDKVTAEVKINCNVSAAPSDLDSAMVDRVCGEYLQQLLGIGKLTGYTFDATVKAITEGDSSFTFADDDSAETKFSKILMQMIDGLNDLEIAYRKLRW
jgi:hypothetical protein